MKRRIRYSPQLAFALLALGLVLTASPAPLGADTPNPESLHLPLTIKGLTGEIRSLRFYESELVASVEFQKRKYQTSFVPAKDKLINWELVLDHPFTREQPKRFLITAVVYDPSGKVLTKSEALAWIETDMPWSQWGNAFRVETGKPGTYQVAVVIEDKEYTRASVQIGGGGAQAPGEDSLKSLNARVTSLRFFAGAKEIPPLGQRNYSQSFGKSQTKFIFWELNLQFPGTRPNQVDFDLQAIWYRPDGSIMDQVTTRHLIKPEWKESAHASGIGSEEAGQWKTGTYRLVLKIKDREVATGSFQVVPDKEAPPPPPPTDFFQRLNAEVVSLKFFEDGRTAPPIDQRRYRQDFAQSAAKWIWYELTLNLARSSPEPVAFAIDETWYGPDGRVINRYTSPFTLKQGWQRPSFAAGIGFDAPGKWKPGSYQVVLKIGDKTVASGTFQVAPAGGVPPGAGVLESLGASVLGVKFYEGPKEGVELGQRRYQDVFARDTSRYIFGELDLKFNQTRPEPLVLPVTYFWYDASGKLFEQSNAKHPIQRDWLDAKLSIGYGWDVPGKWPPGTYSLIIKIQDQKVAVGVFRVN
jgi:hypothetical protein